MPPVIYIFLSPSVSAFMQSFLKCQPVVKTDPNLSHVFLSPTKTD